MCGTQCQKSQRWKAEQGSEIALTTNVVVGPSIFTTSGDF